MVSKKKTIQLDTSSWKGKLSAWMNKACQKNKQLKIRICSWMCGSAKAAMSAAYNAVACSTSTPALNWPRTGNNEPNSGFQCLRCVWCRRNKMAEINGSFKLQARCFGFLRSGRGWPCFDEVLFFLLAPLHLVSLSRRWNVWYEGKPFFIFLVRSLIC